MVGVVDLERSDLLWRREDVHLALDPAAGPLHLGVAGVADQDDLAPLVLVANRLAVDLGDQGARRVDHFQVAARCCVDPGVGDSVGAEHRDRPFRNLLEGGDEARAE